MGATLAPKSREQYERTWKKFSSFCTLLGIISHLPVSVPTLLLFIAHMKFTNTSPRVITSAISILGHFHKINGVTDPTKNFIVSRALIGVRNISNITPDIRLPITLPILSRLLEATTFVITSPNERKLIRAMMTIAFKAFLRVGEMVPQSLSRGAQNCLQVSDLTIESSSIIVRFNRFKHSGCQGPQSLTVDGSIPQSPIDVSRILREFLATRYPTPGILFTLNGKIYPRRTFDSRLKDLLIFCRLDPNSFKGHSFRIGAATFAASNGKSDAYIRAAGRWSSDAFRRYIRLS